MLATRASVVADETGNKLERKNSKKNPPRSSTATAYTTPPASLQPKPPKETNQKRASVHGRDEKSTPKKSASRFPQSQDVWREILSDFQLPAATAHH
jgi:hypothetical protein